MSLETVPHAPPDWERKTVGEIAEVNPAYPVESGKEYPFLEMAAVAENFGGVIELARRNLDSSGLSKFRRNDILFGKITPCPENGKVALVEELPGDYGIGSTEFITLSPRAGYDPRFVYYLLCFNPVHGRAVSRMEGSTGRLRITEDTFTKWLTVAVPKLPEQRAIAAVLGAADAAIERTRAAVAAARRLKRGLVQALLTRGIGHTRFKPSAIGDIPDSWEVVRVGDLLTEAQYGLSMPMAEKGEYPILRMAAIQDGDVLLGDLKYVDLPKELAAQYLLRRGDILFNRTNSLEHVGKVGVFRSDTPAVFASYLIRLKTRSDLVDNYFLGAMLASYSVQCRIRRYATPGVQQVNINATNLQRVFVAIPTGSAGLEEQRLIAEILEAHDDSVRRLERRIELLSRLKRGLMQVLLTGKVRVPVH